MSLLYVTWCRQILKLCNATEGKFPVNITLCGNQVKSEVTNAPRGDKPKETLGHAPAAAPKDGGDCPVTRTELKKIELCTRDP